MVKNKLYKFKAWCPDEKSSVERHFSGYPHDVPQHNVSTIFVMTSTNYLENIFSEDK